MPSASYKWIQCGRRPHNETHPTPPHPATPPPQPILQAALAELVGSALGYGYFKLLTQDIDRVTGEDRVYMREAAAVPGKLSGGLACGVAGLRHAAQPRLLVLVGMFAAWAAFNAAFPDDPLTRLEEGCMVGGFLSYKVRPAGAQGGAGRGVPPVRRMIRVPGGFAVATTKSGRAGEGNFAACPRRCQLVCLAPPCLGPPKYAPPALPQKPSHTSRRWRLS